MVFRYQNIAGDTGDVIGAGAGAANVWRIGYGETANNAKKFITFAVHLFYGIKTKLASGSFTRSFLKPKKPGIRNRGYRASCQNINPALLTNPDQYARSLQPADLNQQYHNNRRALNNQPVDIGTAFLMEDGTAVNTGPIGTAGGNLPNFGSSGLKAAILAVVECFVPRRFRADEKYHYTEFKKWLSENTPVNKGGIPDNSLFNAKEAIENWAKRRVKIKFEIGGLSDDLDSLMNITPDLFVAGDTLQGLGTLNLQQIENKITGFKNYVEGLDEEALKTYKESVEGKEHGLFTKLSLDNDELRYTIKRLGGNPVPNFERSQIRNELQYKRCKIFKDIWEEDQKDGNGNGIQNIINPIIAQTQKETSGLRIPEANVGGAGYVRRTINTALAAANVALNPAAGQTATNAWGDPENFGQGDNGVTILARICAMMYNRQFSPPYNRLNNLLNADNWAGNVPDQSMSGIDGVVAYVMYWIVAANIGLPGGTLNAGVAKPPPIAGGAYTDAQVMTYINSVVNANGRNPDGNGVIGTGNAAATELMVAANAATGTSETAAQYWILAKNTIQNACWNDIANDINILPQPPLVGGFQVPATAGRLSFMFSALVDNGYRSDKPNWVNLFPNLKASYDESQGGNPALKRTGRQQSYITPLQNIQLIADTAAAQMIKKTIQEGKTLNNVVNNTYEAAINCILKNNVSGFNMANVGGTAVASPNQNFNRIAAVHYCIFRAAAEKLTPAPGLTPTLRFALYTAENVVPNTVAPAGGGAAAAVVPPPFPTNYPPRGEYDAAIEAAVAVAAKWVSVFEPS